MSDVTGHWPAPYGTATICDVIDGHTRATPDAIAVADTVRALSYRELRSRTGRLARLIREHGVGTDDVVLLLLPPGIDMIEAMLAVWRSGAAFLPVDPTSAPAWRARTAAASGAFLCLTLTGIDGIPGVHRLDVDRLDLDGDVDGPLPAPILDSLAYVLRTSGTSGVPKLATATHRGMVHLLRTIRDETPELGPDSVVLQHTSPYFDLVVYEILMALGTGASLAVSDRLPSLAEVINDRGVTHTIMPAVLARLLDPADVPGLRVLCTGGDVCWLSTARLWAASATRLINLYGPTEATVAVTLHVVDPGELDGATTVPIGHAMDGARLLILDDALAPVPDGQRGEICIGGPILGRGYLGQPEETALRFVPDPSGAPGDRLYRTGDIGVRRPDGVFEFVGRADFQVKIRGFRVEPREVELALIELPDVDDAVVIADPRVSGGRLLGYVRLTQGRTATGREVRAALAALVPEHLVPGIVTVVESWPLTDNGKIDRAALPLPR